MKELEKAFNDYSEAKETAKILVDSAREKIGTALRNRRQAIGMSLRELARKVGVSAAFISDIELGRRTPSEETEEKIIKNLK